MAIGAQAHIVVSSVVGSAPSLTIIHLLTASQKRLRKTPFWPKGALLRCSLHMTGSLQALVGSVYRGVSRVFLSVSP